MRWLRRSLPVWAIWLALCGATPVWAAEAAGPDTLINRQLDVLDLDALERQTRQALDELGAEETADFSWRAALSGLLAGEGTLSWEGLAGVLGRALLGQVRDQLPLLRNLLLIVLLSAVLKSLNDEFRAKAVGELAFTVCYVVLVLMVMGAFSNGAALVRDAVEELAELLTGMLPVFATLAFSSGRYTYLALAAPLITGGANLLVLGIRRVLLPALTLSAVLTLTNFLTERKARSEFARLSQRAITWGLRGTAGAFLLVLSLLRIGSPGLSRVWGKTAKGLVGAVPVVGQMMSGAVETAAALAGTVQNGLAAVGAVALLLVSLTPLLRLLAMLVLYKVTAAVVEPVAEGRLVKALSAAGDFSRLLLAALFTADVMFLFAVLSMAAQV